MRLFQKVLAFLKNRLKSVCSDFLKARLSGLSLIEVAVALMIVGVIASAILKGKDLLEVARVRALIQDVERYKMAVVHYQETFQSLPGDDPNAHSSLGVDSGDGDGTIGEHDATLFWMHLGAGGFIGSSSQPTSKFGGSYTVVYNPGDGMQGHWYRLGKGEKSKQGLLTPKQAQLLKSKADEGDKALDPNKGSYRIKDGEGAHTCLSGGKINVAITDPVCVAYIAF